jgi:hypothetical protein
MLSFVIYQDGGDENNYVSWFYSPFSEPEGFHALYSSDGGTVWQSHHGVVRAIRVLTPFDPFFEAYADSANHRINSSPGVSATKESDGNAYLASGEFDGTMADEPTESVVLDNGKLLASVIVDGSGSMGWNDRLKKKTLAASQIVAKLQSQYPGDTVFDVITFGSSTLGAIDYSVNEEYAGIEMDLRSPSSTTLNADGTTPSLNDPIIAFGIKDLEFGHHYVVSEVKVGATVLDDGQGVEDLSLGVRIPVNCQSIGSSLSPMEFSIADEGPGSEVGSGSMATIVEMPPSGSDKMRKPFSPNRQLVSTGLVASVVPSDKVVHVESPSRFLNGDIADVVDSNGAVTALTVLASDSVPGGGITFLDEVGKSFGTYESSAGGFVQETSSRFSAYLSNYTTLSVLVKDSASTRNIAFYFQTSGGGTMAWNFRPLAEWVKKQWVYVDDVATISVNADDSQGNTLGGSNEIRYYVNTPPSWEDQLQQEAEIVLPSPEPLTIGDDPIVLPSVSGIVIGDLLTLVDVGSARHGGYTVTEIDSQTRTVTFFPPLDAGMTIVSVAVEHPVNADVADEEAAILLSAVDVTPMVAGRAISPSLLLPTDPPPVPPTQTDYDAYNQDEQRWLHRSFDIPSIGGDAAINVLPITEDALMSKADKQAAVAAATSDTTLTANERMELAAQEDAYADLASQNLDNADGLTFVGESSSQSSASSEESADVVGDDYRVAPGTTSVGGSTSMTTSTASLSSQNWGRFNLAYDLTEVHAGSAPSGKAEILAKTYTVYPVLVCKNASGQVVGRHLLESTEVSFVSPVQVFAKTETGKTVTYECCCSDELGDRNEYDVVVPGVMASSGEPMRVDFAVYHRGILLPSGTMRIKIFDTNRTFQQVYAPREVVPDLNQQLCSPPASCSDSCDNTPSPSDEDKEVFYRSSDGSGYLDSTAANSYPEAVYLEGYARGGVEATIVDGMASYTVPATDVVAKLLVVAEIQVPDSPKLFVRRELPVWFDAPLKVELTVPPTALSGYDAPPPAISAKVTYLGVPVEDNADVQFSGSSHKRHLPGTDGKFDSGSQQAETLGTLAKTDPALADQVSGLISSEGTWPATPIRPSVAKTSGGTGKALGASLGPHGTVVMHTSASGEVLGDSEVVTATVSYGGYQVSVSGTVEWTGTDEAAAEDAFIYCHFYQNGIDVGGEVSLYADGWDSAVVVADIPGSINRSFPTVGLVEDSLLGLDKNPPFGRPCHFSRAHLLPGEGPGRNPGRDIKFYPDRPIDPDTGIAIGDEDLLSEGHRGWAAAWVYDAFAPSDPSGIDSQNIGGNAFGKTAAGQGIQLRGCRSDSVIGCTSYDPETGLTYNGPLVNWMSPLAMAMYFDGKNTSSSVSIIRDGVHRTRVDVDVTFSGRPIPFVAMDNGVVGSNGRPLGFPRVTLGAHYVVSEYDESGKLVGDKIVNNSSLTLSDYNPVVSLSKASEFGGVGGHYHTCEIDGNGNGVTTGTFENGTAQVTADHTHFVVAYAFNSVPDDNGTVHSHSPRSIATTWIEPVSNSSGDICVSASVEYDASRTHVNRRASVVGCTSGDILGDYWTIEAWSPRQAYTARDVTEDYSGFVTKAKLRHFVGGSEVPVPDGIRVKFSVIGFKNTADDDNTIPTFGVGRTRNYATVAVGVSASPVVGTVLNTQASVLIRSDLEWLPSVSGLTSKPTQDVSYIADALASVSDVMGTSQICDAVSMAADRMRQWVVDNPSWSSCNRLIFLLSDGYEVGSDKSAEQAIESVNGLAGTGAAPVNVFLFGLPDAYDSIVAWNLSSQTHGREIDIPLGFPVSQMVTKVNASMVTASKVFGAGSNFNAGAYRNTVDIGASQLMRSILVNVDVPSGALAAFKARMGDDGASFGPWLPTITLASSGTVSLQQQVHRYVQYEVAIMGNSSFQSPHFYGVVTSYVKAGETTVYFQPVMLDISGDDYVSEVVVTDEGELPVTSEVKYGLVQDDTTDERDYYSHTFPLFGAGRRAITLTRFNELGLSTDNRTYRLVNGGWPESASVEVSRLPPGDREGQLLDPATYVANPSDGTITLFTAQPDGTKIVATVSQSPVIRLICKIVNRSEDAATLDHIGITYNVTRRIKRLPDGTISKQPISMVIDVSSSSSSSSESSSSG